MTHHRKWLMVYAAAGAACVLMCSAGVATARPTTTGGRQSNQLIIAGYGVFTPARMQQYILGPFTKDTGINVTWLQVPGQQVAGIEAQNQAHNIQWDMTLGLADTDMATLWSQGDLATMPASLEAEIKKQNSNVTSYGVPSKQGAVMITCNYKLVAKCPKNAAQLFNTAAYPGPRMFPSFQPLVLLTFAWEALGLKPAQMYPDNQAKALALVKRGETEMDKIRSSIKTFYSSSTQALQLLDSGETTIAGLWNGASNSAFSNPTANLRSGSTWTNAVTYAQWDVVYKGAPNEANAWKLIKWMAEHPTAVAGYAQADTAGVVDPRAFKLLPPKEKQWLPTTINRPVSVVENPVWYVKYPAVKAAIDTFWENYTTG